VAGENAAAVAELLTELAPGGFSVEEPYVPLGPDEGARLEPWRPTLLRVYLARDDDLGSRRQRLERGLAALPFRVQVHERPVQEEDWAESWKQFFQVERAGRHVVIRPSWREYEPKPGDVVIELDPGMAFGTGQHPTTRLCLAALEDFLRAGTNVLDLGCGSGILAVAAVKLGGGQVWALDTEQIAVEATRANAGRNGVAERIHCARGSLGDAWPHEQPAQALFDLIVANISAGVLVALAAPLAAALRPDGAFVGSGIIAERLDEVLVATAAAGLWVEEIRADGDWRAVIAGRRGA